MSTHAVKIIEIETVNPHENADRLGIVNIGGWSCVVAKEQFKPGDRAVYVEPDYVVQLSRPEFAFLAKGKEGKTEHRMKAVRLRGQLSFGLLIPVPDEFFDLPVGSCVMDAMSIRRYEPPVKNFNPGVDDTLPQDEWPTVYAGKFDLEDLRKHEHLFQPGDQVYVTEKLHGGNGKIVWHNDRLYVGSRTRWLQTGIRSLWTRAMQDSSQAERLAELCKAHPDVVFYGEVFGPVQELRYGLTEPEFAIFAACAYGEWWWSEKLFSVLAKFDVLEAPALFRGAYDRDKIAEIAERDTSIKSAPNGHMMEGVVIVAEPPRRDQNIGRVALKLISNRYWES
jgi:RNA ligase (TIGR02306 family)